MCDAHLSLKKASVNAKTLLAIINVISSQLFQNDVQVLQFFVGVPT